MNRGPDAFDLIFFACMALALGGVTVAFLIHFVWRGP